MSRRRGGEVNALAERLARASSIEVSRAWEQMDDDERSRWIAAWQPTALSLRARKALPLSDREVTTIAQTHRRIESSGSEPPRAGMTEAAQMVIDLRIRGG
ncbi:hypothetical protein CryarDRAFT_3620 [Cryptosporangium arvum DSM 44712]|uniref:Uncharacterized protein n=1 Tax=Cryptosporangium arvum DSM 44712 TaxID=927661 RepID=A0A011AKD9_9ACTN|nr:hypothetical protein CryarDRAFT_3620 [Cryptosporangium arvum DSM 44712]